MVYRGAWALSLFCEIRVKFSENSFQLKNLLQTCVVVRKMQKQLFHPSCLEAYIIYLALFLRSLTNLFVSLPMRQYSSCGFYYTLWFTWILCKDRRVSAVICRFMTWQMCLGIHTRVQKKIEITYFKDTVKFWKCQSITSSIRNFDMCEFETIILQSEYQM